MRTAEAHALVQHLLEGVEQAVDIADRAKAEALAEAVSELGAIATVEEHPHSNHQ